MKRKIFLLLPFLLLAITKCEEPKKEKRNSGRKKVKIEKRPSKLYRMMQIGAVVVPAIIILGIVLIMYRSNTKKSDENIEESEEKKTVFSASVKEIKTVKDLKKEDQVFFNEQKEKKIKTKDFLSLAITKNKLDVVKLIVVSIESKEAKEKALLGDGICDDTPLHEAAEKGEIEMVTFLLTQIKNQKKALNAKNTDRSTPLGTACKFGRLDVVEYLVKQEEAIGIIKGNKSWNFCCKFACQEGHLDVIKYFVEKKGIKPEDDLGNGRNLFHFAAYYYNSSYKIDKNPFKVLKYLLGKITNEEDKKNALEIKINNGGINCLMILCRAEKNEDIKKFLNQNFTNYKAELSWNEDAKKEVIDLVSKKK